MTAVATALAVILGLVALSSLVGSTLRALGAARQLPVELTPAVGMAALILALVPVSFVVPLGHPAAIASVPALTAALLVATWWRRRARPGVAAEPLMSRAEMGRLLAALTVGLVVMMPTLSIIQSSSSTALVHLDENHDGFFFAVAPAWLLDHRATDSAVDRLSTDPEVPLVSSVWDIYDREHRRFGSEAVTAWTAAVLKADPVNVWLPVALGFQAIFVCACVGAARMFGLGRGAALVAAAVVGSCGRLLGEVTSQHSPTLIALAFALVLLVQFDRGRRVDRTGWSPLIVALAGGALIAVYGELSAVVLPVLAVLVLADLVRWLRARPASAAASASTDDADADTDAGSDVGLEAFAWLRRWVTVAPWALAVGAAPLLWTAGARLAHAPEGYVARLGLDRGLGNLVRAAALGPGADTGSWADASLPARAMVLAFVLALIGGLALAITARRQPLLWSSLVVTTVAGWWWFGRWTYSGYRQERFSEWALVLLVFGAAVGWLTLAGRASPKASTPAPVPDVASEVAPASRRVWHPFALGCIGLTLVLLPGLSVAWSLPDRPERRVAGDLVAPADWIEQRDPTGASTLVATGGYLATLWTPYTLRDAAATAYVNQESGYYHVRWLGDLEGRRWLLVDSDAVPHTRAPAGAVAAVNDRFTLIDLAVGPVDLDLSPHQTSRWGTPARAVTVHFEAGTTSCRANDVSQAELPC